MVRTRASHNAPVGLEEVGGSRVDASSNYDRMMGPLVGLSGGVQFGRSRVSGSLGLSTLFGDNELTTSTRDFRGDPEGCQFDADGCPRDRYTTSEEFKTEQGIAIPVTELDMWYTFQLTEMIGLSLGANATTWFDASVPPGVIPQEDGNDAVHENTILYWGLSSGVSLQF